MNPSSISMRQVSRRTKNTQTFGEILVAYALGSSKSMLSGLYTLFMFVISPVWNHGERMRQLTHWFVIGFGGIVLLWVFYWIGQRPVFNIEQIQVQSASDVELEHIKVPMIKAKAMNQFSGNFFTLRLDIARRAFEELPWVRVASVRRVWPNQLQVSIEEHEPVGIWFGQNGPELINTYGELFTVNLAEISDRKNLVSFQGPPNTNKEVLELYQYLDHWFARMDRKVVALTLSPRYSWTVKLDDGMIFELGRDLNSKDRKQINERLERFFRFWPELQSRLPNPIEYVDLRYNQGFSVKTGLRSESKLNEMKLAGLNQKIAMPVDESEIDIKNIIINTGKNKNSSKMDNSSLDKSEKRSMKKVKQSDRMGNSTP